MISARSCSIAWRGAAPVAALPPSEVHRKIVGVGRAPPGRLDDRPERLACDSPAVRKRRSHRRLVPLARSVPDGRSAPSKGRGGRTSSPAMPVGFASADRSHRLALRELCLHQASVRLAVHSVNAAAP